MHCKPLLCAKRVVLPTADSVLLIIISRGVVGHILKARMAGLRLQWAVLLLCMTMVQADAFPVGEDGFRSLTGAGFPNPVRLASNMVGATGARQLLQDADASATEGVDAAAGNIASDA